MVCARLEDALCICTTYASFRSGNACLVPRCATCALGGCRTCFCSEFRIECRDNWSTGCCSRSFLMISKTFKLHLFFYLLYVIMHLLCVFRKSALTVFSHFCSDSHYCPFFSLLVRLFLLKSISFRSHCIFCDPISVHSLFPFSVIFFLLLDKFLPPFCSGLVHMYPSYLPRLTPSITHPNCRFSP